MGPVLKHTFIGKMGYHIQLKRLSASDRQSAALMMHLEDVVKIKNTDPMDEKSDF